MLCDPLKKKKKKERKTLSPPPHTEGALTAEYGTVLIFGVWTLSSEQPAQRSRGLGGGGWSDNNTQSLQVGGWIPGSVGSK